jgi:hypothetical protein
MSSARFGLIPKSAGGKMALGGMGALGVAAGVRSYRNRSSAANIRQGAMDAYARQDVLQGITSGSLPVPQGAVSVQDMRSGRSYGIPQ